MMDLQNFFFQFYWDIIDSDVFAAIRSFFPGGRILRSFNHTHICLIPKVDNKRDMSQVRSISLCSVFYKII